MNKIVERLYSASEVHAIILLAQEGQNLLAYAEPHTGATPSRMQRTLTHMGAFPEIFGVGLNDSRYENLKRLEEIVGENLGNLLPFGDTGDTDQKTPTGRPVPQ